jgi:gliding motility-associated-like protein
MDLKLANNMKNIILIVSLLSLFFSNAQEVEHSHSLHHGFIENKGQWDQNILFKSHFQGGNLWIQQRKFVFHFQDYRAYQEKHTNFTNSTQLQDNKQHVLHLNFPGSSTVYSIQKEKKSEAYFNFFKGNDPQKWVQEAYSYSEAKLKDFYPGIDLMLIEKDEQLKYEFQVAPYVNPALIQLEFEGHSSLKIDKKGNLLIQTPLGQLMEEKPFAYQIKNGKIAEIPCSFKIKNKRVFFEVGNYDKSVPLVIDPILIFATYAGSVSDNFGMTATYGYDGTAYSAGIVYGNDYPTPDASAYDINSNFTIPNVSGSITTDVFISKYNTDGSTMLWTTYLGGGDDTQGTETAHSLICDKQNNIYIYGITSSLDFPMQNAYQNTHNGGTAYSVNSNGANFGSVGTDIFVSKISANGQNLLASTYFGGALNDGANYRVAAGSYNGAGSYDSLTTNYGDQFRGEIMLDQNNNVLIASCTRSDNFPTLNAVQNARGGEQDGVIFRLSNDLSALDFSTYIGGTRNDACYSIKIDSSYNIVFAGGTSSSNLPGTSGAYQASYNGGKTDGFVGKLSPNGQVLQRISYLGTPNYDQVFFVEIDREDNVFVLGQSTGGQFPIINAAYSNPNSAQFIAKLSPDLTTISNSTVFGNGSGQINISPSAFLVDNCGNIYVSGWGANILQSVPMSGMPVSTDAFQGTSPNGFDFYLIVLERNMSGLLYATYLGGPQSQEHVDGGTSRFDKNGVVYQSVCGGCGANSDFPVSPNAWSDQNLSPNCNNLVFKFDFEIVPSADFSANQTAGCATFEVIFDNSSTETDDYLWDFGNGNVDSTTFNPIVVYDTPGTYTVFLYVTDSICQITDTAQIQIQVLDSLLVDAGSEIQLCNPSPIQLIGNSFGTGTQFIWSEDPSFTTPLNGSPSDSTATVTPSVTGYFYFQAANSFCSKYDSVLVSFTSSALSLSGDTLLCLGDQSTITVTNANPAINFTYSWEPSSIILQNNQTSVVINPTGSQYLVVTGSASNGCIIEDSILVQVSPLGGINVTATASEYTVTSGTTVTLTGSPSGFTTTWTPIDAVQNPSALQTTALIEENTLFTFTASDGICSKSDTVLIKVMTFLCDKSYVYVPNAFSPNGDGENDVLFVRSALLKELEFRVFNRWGEMVFESNSTQIGWDGTFRNKPLTPDVYDYYLKAVCVEGEEKILKGNVTLLR